jgi:divinyl chlorophyllide a 8-vinyl-reductase
MRSVPVVAILRDRLCENDQRSLSALGARLAYVDASQFGSYTDALLNVDVAISCMASANIHVEASDDFWAIDRDANIRFGIAAIEAGASHIVLVATFEGIASRPVTAFSEAKEAAVDVIGTACRGAGKTFTVIRPTAYFSDLTDRAFDSVLKQGRYTVLGDGMHRINPVDGCDVAVFIAKCLSDPTKAGREHPIGGPETFSFFEIGRLAADVLGRTNSLKIRKIPIWFLQLVAAIVSAAGMISRRSRRSAAILKWMIYAGTHDAVAPICGDRKLRDHFLSKLRIHYARQR